VLVSAGLDPEFLDGLAEAGVGIGIQALERCQAGAPAGGDSGTVQAS
jgi:hypothetical protein